MRSLNPVSLLDMMTAIGGCMTALANVVHMMSQVSEGVQSGDEGLAFRPEYHDAMIEMIDDLERVATELNLDATLYSTGYCKTVLSRCYDGPDGQICLKRSEGERLVSALDALRTNFLAQMNSRLVIVVDTRYASYLLSDQQPFGSDVEDAFPKAAAEISEAGKCMALGRPTATVFHLMRAMELAVEGLGLALGKNVSGKVWGVMLSDISSAIEALPKGDARNTWSSVHAHLYHVKQAWRNDTMHPKTTYTEEEAEAVFQAVKSFMIALAPMVSDEVSP